jgi:hypothetical protein
LPSEGGGRGCLVRGRERGRRGIERGRENGEAKRGNGRWPCGEKDGGGEEGAKEVWRTSWIVVGQGHVEGRLRSGTASKSPPKRSALSCFVCLLLVVSPLSPFPSLCCGLSCSLFVASARGRCVRRRSTSNSYQLNIWCFFYFMSFAVVITRARTQCTNPT